jgi:hypothetical protein
MGERSSLEASTYSPERFESTAEFANFKAGMKRLLEVPKSRLDELVRRSKEKSPRAGNPNSAGRKKRHLD